MSALHSRKATRVCRNRRRQNNQRYRIFSITGKIAWKHKFNDHRAGNAALAARLRAEPEERRKENG
jgi:hypothetical protein